MVQAHKQQRLSHEIQLALAQKMFASMTLWTQVLAFLPRWFNDFMEVFHTHIRHTRLHKCENVVLEAAKG